MATSLIYPSSQVSACPESLPVTISFGDEALWQRCERLIVKGVSSVISLPILLSTRESASIVQPLDRTFPSWSVSFSRSRISPSSISTLRSLLASSVRPWTCYSLPRFHWWKSCYWSIASCSSCRLATSLSPAGHPSRRQRSLSESIHRQSTVRSAHLSHLGCIPQVATTSQYPCAHLTLRQWQYSWSSALTLSSAESLLMASQD